MSWNKLPAPSPEETISENWTFVREETPAYSGRARKMWVLRCRCGQLRRMLPSRVRGERFPTVCDRCRKAGSREGRGTKRKYKDGERFGHWTILGFHEGRYLLRCECGAVHERGSSSLRSINPSGRCRTCQAGRYKNVKTRHPLYRTYAGMIERCTNEDCSHWDYYGGRGIRVCSEWIADFFQFVRDVGEKPGPEYSLDRIDNDGDYEPGNVRWATAKTQASNRRGLRRLTARGETRTVGEWSELAGVKATVILGRIKNQWSVEDAIFTPLFGRQKRGVPLPPVGDDYSI